MCGIVGVIDLKAKREIDKKIIEDMADMLIHRGPDDCGYYFDKGVAFGFRRLSIIDLSCGNQPHFNETKDIVSICNGEIYNYKELKSGLINRGHKFNANSDVEVLVHLFEENPYDFVKNLNGQFAFAIYDKKNQEFMLCRDHVGIAPIFYTISDGFLIFASEIKAILKFPNIKKEVNLNSLDQLFTFPSIVSPNTMFKDIYSLKAGHFLKIKNGEMRECEYWDLDYRNTKDLNLSEIELQEAIIEKLKKAIDLRLQADVPVGFYLSGGLDSSLIGSLIKKLSPNSKRDSFSILFKDRDIDERNFQRMMSEKLNSTHHEYEFDMHEIAKRLKSAIYYAETPLKESYNTCSLALSKLVNSSNIKVVLTGEGSDELFGGYVGYRMEGLRDEDLDSIEGAFEKEIRNKIFGDENFFYEKNYYEFKELKDDIYSNDLRAKLYEFDATTKKIIDTTKLIGIDNIKKRSYCDFKLRIADHLLADHGDRVSYANSIEARYPFLDIEFIEFVKNIDSKYLVKNGVEKYILKEASKKYLPHEITSREKFAFVAPSSQFLLKENIEWINDMLSYEKIKREGFFNPDMIERIKKHHLSSNSKLNQTFETDFLMVVLTFEIFLEQFLNANNL